MYIAVTYENGNVFQHFGHTEQFKIYSVDDGKVVGSSIVDTNGSGHGTLAGFLQEHSVDTLRLWWRKLSRVSPDNQQIVQLRRWG